MITKQVDFGVYIVTEDGTHHAMQTIQMTPAETQMIDAMYKELLNLSTDIGVRIAAMDSKMAFIGSVALYKTLLALSTQIEVEKARTGKVDDDKVLLDS
jgi:hypothetical protein